ncbi:MAG: FISUMP domain-containing protein [Bacteroidota bacterium]
MRTFSIMIMSLLLINAVIAQKQPKSSTNTQVNKPVVQNLVELIPLPVDSFIDSRDNRLYHTVKIGKTWWMSDNLAYKNEKDCWCYFKTDSICSSGRFYTLEVSKNLCPDGWSFPDSNDFINIISFYGKDMEKTYQQFNVASTKTFNALKLGYYWPMLGDISGKQKYARYWSSSIYQGEKKKYCYFEVYGPLKIVRLQYTDNNTVGYNVRCIKKE